MKKPKQRHLRHEFDVITVTPDGSVVWRRYGGDRRIVVAGPNENPRTALARQLREARKKRRKR
jgi:hypothetical protein